MLFRSGDNLLNEAKQFCTNSDSLWLYSPFIRVDKIQEINDNPMKYKAIIVRWQTMDILVGVSDFEELFNYCEINNIALYRNTRIHLKAIRNEENSIFFGSANFTNMGMGIGQYNLELSGKCENPDFEDISYLNNILRDSDIVTREYFDILKQDIDEKKLKFQKIKRIQDKSIQSIIINKFLLDTLPQTENPQKLWKIYSNTFDVSIFTSDEIECAKNDLKTYNVTNNLSEIDFYDELKIGFNSNPFILALKEEIKKQSNLTMGYTQIIKWIVKTTLTVPTPTRWDIKDKKWVNNIHNWLPFLDNVNFYSEKRHPHGSDLLHFIGKKDNYLEAFINSLRFDKASGQNAPHQYILLVTLNELNSNNKSITLDIIKKYFNINWNSFKHLYPNYKSNYAMPIKAFVNQGIITLEYKEGYNNIDDYRNEKELDLKLKSIKMNKILLDVMNKENISSDKIMSYYK